MKKYSQEDLLVSVKKYQWKVEEERGPLARDEEKYREEGMSKVFRENELRASVSLQSIYDIQRRSTHLIQLVAEVNRVDIIALQIREHDNLNPNKVSLTGLSYPTSHLPPKEADGSRRAERKKEVNSRRTPCRTITQRP